MKMQTLVAALLALPMVAMSGLAHNAGCPARIVTEIPDFIDLYIGGAPSPIVYWVDYDNDGQLTGDDWLYLESGALEGLQEGNGEVLLHATFLAGFYPHSHRCIHPNPDQRDYLLY